MLDKDLEQIEKQLGKDLTILFQVAEVLGYPTEFLYKEKSREALFCASTLYAINVLKRALNGKEDAEYILFLWNQSEEIIEKLDS